MVWYFINNDGNSTYELPHAIHHMLCVIFAKNGCGILQKVMIRVE